MKSFAALRMWMPLLGLGAMLALAPQSCAQADVSPDHFDENGVWDTTVPVKLPAVKGKPGSSSAQARNTKAGAQTKAQAASSKNPAAQQPGLVAVNDKRKVTAQKTNKP